MAPPPPPPPPPAGGYGGAGSSGSYYGANAGSTSSAAARRRLGLKNKSKPGGGGGASSSSSQDVWFATPAPAPAPSMAAPSPAAASSSSSGFYSANAGGSNDAASASSSGFYNPYGGGGNAAPSAAGTSSGGGGYYGSSTGAMGGGSGGYAGSTSNAMSGAIGGATSTAPAAVPPSNAFGSNPNSGSSAQMSLGGSNSFETGGLGGGGSFEMGGTMSGSMGGPIGGAAPAAAPSAPAPHVFDPNAAVAKKAEESHAMAPIEEDYENEPPLLEELGVNFPHIYSKSWAVLIPFGKHAKSLEAGLIEEDADLAGPLAFALGLGGELLLAGKLHFGYVYGFGVSGCLAMTLLLNLLNPNGAVSAWTVVSILGYALLPVNLLAGINAVVRIHKLGKLGMAMSVLTILWCTMASTRLFERGCNMRAQRFLVAYPTAMLYTAFVLITIF